MFGGIGFTELGVIFAVALIFFGPQRLPEMARSMGRALGEFRRASSDLRQSLREAQDAGDATPPPAGKGPAEATGASLPAAKSTGEGEAEKPTGESPPNPGAGEAPVGDAPQRGEDAPPKAGAAGKRGPGELAEGREGAGDAGDMGVAAGAKRPDPEAPGA